MNRNLNLFNVIAVDGTYSNTNLHNQHKLETCLNMGLQALSDYLLN